MGQWVGEGEKADGGKRTGCRSWVQFAGALWEKLDFRILFLRAAPVSFRVYVLWFLRGEESWGSRVSALVGYMEEEFREGVGACEYRFAIMWHSGFLGIVQLCYFVIL